MTSTPPENAPPATEPKLEIVASPGFAPWLAAQRASLVFTTYQTGKVFWAGLQPGGALSIFERTLERVMGMCVHGEEIFLSTITQVWRFRNLLGPGERHQGYDRLYLPRESHVTGDIDVHDMVVEDSGRLVFVNTLFNCLATLDDDYSFRPIWKPAWISTLAPEDRCHLNGLALRDGVLRTVTAVGRADVADGWRALRRDGGVVVDVPSGSVMCEGLSMPHSPRWNGGKLYVIQSGTGELGRVDPDSGRFEPISFCPGYARGLAFSGGCAIVGLSDRRENRTFQELPLEDALARHNAEPRCGLQVIDLQSGATVHTLHLSGVVRELYDVAVIPGAIRPMAIGFRGDEIKRVLSHPGFGPEPHPSHGKESRP